MPEKKTNISEIEFSLPPYRRINIIPLLLFNLYVVVWWLEVGKRIPLLASIRFEFLLGAALGILALISYSKKADKNSGNHDVANAALLFLFISFSSLPLAVNFEIAWQAYIDWEVKYAIMALFISQFVASPQTLVFFLLSSFLAFFKIGQEAFWGTVTGNMVWYNQGIPRLFGTPGTMFGHPNSLSGKTVSSLAFIYYSLPFAKKIWLKALIAVQLIFSLTIILYTGSRTGYLTVIALLFFIVLLSKKKIYTFIVLVILSLFSIQYIPEHYQERFLSSFDESKAQGRSSEARTNLFFDSISVFLRNPLGVGLNCFPEVQRKEGRNPQQTHNLYTQLLAEAGIQGFTCFVYLIWVIIRKIRKSRNGFMQNIGSLHQYKSQKNKGLEKVITNEINSNKFLLAVANAVLVFIFVRLVLGIFGHDLLEIYWWISAGLSMAIYEILVISKSRVLKISSIISTTT